MKRFLLLLFVLPLLLAQSPARAAGDAPEVMADGAIGNVTAVKSTAPNGDVTAVMPVGGGYLRLQFVTDSVVHVSFAKNKAFSRPESLMAVKRPAHKPVVVMTGSGRPGFGTAKTWFVTSALYISVDRPGGAVRFFDHGRRLILAEKPGGRTMEPATVQGEKTSHVQQQWRANPGEALYGLGQHQLGLMDIKGYDLDLWQHNGTVSIPFLVSSRGYGVLWDNNSYTRFGDLRQTEPIPAARLIDMSGKPGGLTGSYYSDANFQTLVGQRSDPVIDFVARDAGTSLTPPFAGQPQGGAIRWEGDIVPTATGDHTFKAYSNGGIQMWIDGKLLMNHWRQSWLPWIDVAKVRLVQGRRTHIRLEWTREGGTTMQFTWKTPSTNADTSLWSEVGDGVDYYVVYGPSIPRVISGYRTITGKAALMPIWAFGLWQSRQRYATQQESLDVIDGFRSRHIPFDNIVQDWFYWKADSWGSHQFDPIRFPDPDAWIKAIHDKHARLMISVWPKFYPGTDNFNAMQSRGFLYQPNLKEHIIDWVGFPDTFYDAFNPAARKLYWSQMESRLFDKGVDAWWMDASEPDMLSIPTLEGVKTHMNPTYLGTASRVLNGFPLENSKGVYEGQRSKAPNQRVFILTRSGYAGQQRYAAATWSGDISSTWTALQKQVQAGLGFSISGVPYWTMDIGGFSVPSRFSSRTPTPENREEWLELNARWFEFGTFVPLLRAHGEYPNREMWEMGGETHPAYLAERKFDRIRYRLLPYIYSLAGAATQDDGTIMRPLVMDFQTDAIAKKTGDEYMFGPEMLVTPVTTFKQRHRPVYLPKSAGWYDFWTGVKSVGGQSIDAAAPYDAIPIEVKAGSILPVGPEIEYATEKSADPITLYIYSGADGSFKLYEDEGVNYDYEKGRFSNIPMTWNNASRTLTLGKRIGSFPGMLRKRTFNIVLVSKSKPVGFSFTPRADRTVAYNGSEIKATFGR